MKYLNQILIIVLSGMIMVVSFQNCGPHKMIKDGTFEEPASTNVETTEMHSSYSLNDVKSVQISRATNSLSKAIKGEFYFEQNLLKRTTQIEVASSWENKCPNDSSDASSYESSLADILEAIQEGGLISTVTYSSRIYREAGDLFSGLIVTVNLKDDKSLIYSFSHNNETAAYPNAALSKESADLILKVLDCAH